MARYNEPVPTVGDRLATYITACDKWHSILFNLFTSSFIHSFIHQSDEMYMTAGLVRKKFQYVDVKH